MDRLAELFSESGLDPDWAAGIECRLDAPAVARWN
jgi:hypothetical protein